MQKEPMTAKDYDNLTETLNDLKLVQRPKILVATKGTAKYIEALGFEVKKINKVKEGRPHTVDMLLNKEVDLVINTTEGKTSIEDSASIRQSALRNKILVTTTMFGAFAIVEALNNKEENWNYISMQEINI